jgi:hypothetical protein
VDAIRVAQVVRRPHQAEIGLVYQRGCLKCLPRLLLSEARGGKLSQLVVDEWEQIGRGVRVAGHCGIEQTGDIGHGCEDTHTGRGPQGRESSAADSGLSWD